MSSLTFSFRLRSLHGITNPVSQEPTVEFLTPEGAWQPQLPTLSTPGFRLYLLSLLLCQHHYLVANAQEKGIPLAQVDGTFTVQASASWIIETIAGDFQLQLKPGAALERKEMDFLESRMKACPVSRNLPESVLKMITVNLAP